MNTTDIEMPNLLDMKPIVSGTGIFSTHWLNTLRSEQNGWYFADDIFEYISSNAKFYILIRIEVIFASKGPINNKSTLVQVMARRWTGSKLLPEPMLIMFSYAMWRHDATMSKWNKSNMSIWYNHFLASFNKSLSSMLNRHNVELFTATPSTPAS